jgi:outer membrane protein assembly factor BamB
LPATWSETEHVAWKVPLDGLGWSSPVVAEGRIYLTTAVERGGDARTLRALCLDARTGRTIWDKEVFQQRGPAEKHGKNSHASPTPLVEAGRVYVHFGPHGTACLTTEGEVVWSTQQLKYGPRHGNGGSPALAGDLLIICCDGWDAQYVVGLDKGSGRIRWKTPRETSPAKGFSFSTPLVIEANGQSQAVCPGSDAVFAYDAATGDELWRVDYDGYSVIPRPVFAEGLVFVSSGYDRAELIAIDPVGRGNVTQTHVKWRTTRNAPHSASPLAVGTELYFVSDDGVARCVDARTGEEHWRKRLGGNYSASPTYADGKVYFQDEHGTATVVQAGTEGEELARNTFADGARTFASYAVADDALFIRSETHLYRIAGPRAARAPLAGEDF